MRHKIDGRKLGRPSGPRRLMYRSMITDFLRHGKITTTEAKAKEIAAIKDPVKFAFAIAKLEAQLKVSTKKPAVQPEGRIQGNARPSGTIDSTLERLREEANKTGDYSKVMEYKRKKRG